MLHPKVLSFLVLLAIEMPFALVGANPAKMVAEARFDLTSPTVNLEKVEVLAGNGKIERMKWVQERRKVAVTRQILQSPPSVLSPPRTAWLTEADGAFEGTFQRSAYKQELLWKEYLSQPERLLAIRRKAWSGNVIVEEKATASNAPYFARTK